MPKAAAWRGFFCDTAFVLNTAHVLRSVYCEGAPDWPVFSSASAPREHGEFCPESLVQTCSLGLRKGHILCVPSAHSLTRLWP